MAEIKNNKYFGILGGSFNPVHNGHISCAEIAKRKLRLDRLFFVPAYISPFKTEIEPNNNLLNKRIEMLSMILSDKDEIIDYEIKQKGVSYTINTVEYILKKYEGNITLFLIIGSDNFNVFHKWHKYKELLKLVELAVIERPAFPCKNKLIKKYIMLGKSEYDISSSDIRKMLMNRKNINEFVPDIINEYIIKEKLYTI